MLVLSRKVDESFIIKFPDGKCGRIVITDLNPKKVKIGFEMPSDVIIVREELEPSCNN